MPLVPAARRTWPFAKHSDSGGTMATLAVQCPEGYIPGTILAVMTLDGLTVNAQVPDACAPGGTFHVIYKKPA